MKKILFLLSAMVLISFSSCIKELEDVEAPGNISGLGNTEGEINIVEAYELPEGIEFVGDIVGVVETPSVNDAPDLKFATGWNCYGSGGRFVRLAMTIRNNHNKPRTVYFPRGLVWGCQSGSEYQHGMLAQSTWFCFNPHAQRTIWLDLYCVNYGRHGSDENSYYGCLGVIASPVMHRLLRLFGPRKVNREHFKYITGAWAPALKSTSEDSIVYEDITDVLQDAIWGLTNFGTDITDEQVEFIESLPEMEPGTYPESLFAETPIIPTDEYFPEYGTEE